MTNINDIADFVNIIRNNPQWADVVRGILLGQELLALPAQFAEFVQLTQETNRLTNERLTGVEGRLTGVEGRLTGVENQTANLMGSDIERRVHGNVINLTGRRLGLRRAQVLRSNIMSIDPELQQAIEEAEDQGLITSNQAEQVENTDIIIRGFSPVEGSDVHPAIEVSRTIHDDDITRARERADNLAKIMGTSPLAIAVVIGGRIDPPPAGTGRRACREHHNPTGSRRRACREHHNPTGSRRLEHPTQSSRQPRNAPLERQRGAFHSSPTSR